VAGGEKSAGAGSDGDGDVVVASAAVPRHLGVYSVIYWEGVSSAMLFVPVSFILAEPLCLVAYRIPMAHGYAHSQNCTGYSLPFPWGYFGEPPILLPSTYYFLPFFTPKIARPEILLLEQRMYEFAGNTTRITGLSQHQGAASSFPLKLPA
jgi:hypothetical protein